MLIKKTESIQEMRDLISEGYVVKTVENNTGKPVYVLVLEETKNKDNILLG